MDSNTSRILSSIIMLGGFAYFLKIFSTDRKTKRLDVNQFLQEPISRMRRARQYKQGMNPEAMDNQFMNVVDEMNEQKIMAAIDKTSLYTPEGAWRTPTYNFREDFTADYNN